VKRKETRGKGVNARGQGEGKGPEGKKLLGGARLQGRRLIFQKKRRGGLPLQKQTPKEGAGRCRKFKETTGSIGIQRIESKKATGK